MPPTHFPLQTGRLWSVDALRGCAALGVVLYHSLGVGHLIDPREPWPTSETFLPRVASLGASGVMLFFVISGFCIHLRWAGSADRSTFHWGAFWQRRFLRLYPAYLAALILYAGSLTLRHAWKGDPTYELALHLGLVQNLDPRVAFSLTGVFWSLAVEEQLYALYPLLVNVRERCGWRTTLLALIAIRFVTFLLCDWSFRTFKVAPPFGASAPALWICWALGAFAAEAHCGRVRLPSFAAHGWVFPGLVVGSLLMKDVQYLLDPSSLASKLWWFVGQPTLPVVTALGYFVCLNAAIARGRRRLARDARSPCLRALTVVGLFSYSLYLTHEWILRDLVSFVGAIDSISGAWLADHRSLLIPGCLAAAYGFFCLFERPFLRGTASLPRAPGIGDESPARKPGSPQASDFPLRTDDRP